MVEYPIIEPGTVIEWKNSGSSTDVTYTVAILSMYADEDGKVQLRISETAPDTQDTPRTITLSDLHYQLQWRDYEVKE